MISPSSSPAGPPRDMLGITFSLVDDTLGDRSGESGGVGSSSRASDAATFWEGDGGNEGEAGLAFFNVARMPTPVDFFFLTNDLLSRE